MAQAQKSPWILQTLTGHSGRVLAVCFNADFTQIATASDDRTCRLWSVATNTCLHVLTGHEMRVNSCTFSPDGTQLATASYDSTLRLWDVATGECSAMLEGHESAVNAVCYSPDGALLSTCSDDNSVAVWDAASGEILSSMAGHWARVVNCSFSPDGARIASASYDNTVKVWVVATGECQRSLDGHTNWVLCAAFSPDDGGARIASASWDNSVKVWEVASGACMRTIRHNNTINSCAFSTDGLRLASASYDASVKVWDVATATCLHTLTGHAGAVNAVTYMPDGTIASASDDNSVKLWGYPHVYKWLAGLKLEMFYDGIAGKNIKQLAELELLSEIDLMKIGMSAEQATRFADYALKLADSGYALPAETPAEQLKSFISQFVGAVPARLVIDRIGLATVEDLGDLQEPQLVAAGLNEELAKKLLAAAEEQGYGEVIRARREEERRRAKEQERVAGIVMRSGVDGVQRALLALQTSGAPPTATGFFVSHHRAEGEQQADALGDDLILASEQVLGLSIEEVWCGHQVFPTDLATETAMLNGVRGATAFLLLLTRSALTRPYIQMELRAAAAIRKPIVFVHESDDRNGGAELSTIIESAPEDIQVLFDSLEVIPHRRKPEERRIMLNDIYHAARAQGGVFHAMISISAHASLLAEIAQLKQALAAEKELVAELGQSTLITEINMLKAELEQENTMTALERKKVEEMAERNKRLQSEAQVWEKNLQRALEREHEARRQVEELTDTVEHLQGEEVVREQALQASVAELNDDMFRLTNLMEVARKEEDKKRRSNLHKVSQYALAGLFQSVAGGQASADPDTLKSFLEYINFSSEEAAELVDNLARDETGNVDAAAWTSLADDILGTMSGPAAAAAAAARDKDKAEAALKLAAEGAGPAFSSTEPKVMPGGIMREPEGGYGRLSPYEGRPLTPEVADPDE